jgi:hypothetical protein
MATGGWPWFDIVVDSNNIPMDAFVNLWLGSGEPPFQNPMLAPPSTGKMTPVTNLAAGEQR